MVFFGVEVLETKESLKFFDETIKRSNQEDFIKNPYDKGGVIKYDEGFYIVNLKPLYPRIYLVGFFALAISFILTGKILSYYHIIGLLILSLYFFFSNSFFMLMLYLGLRKAKYKHKIKFIKLLEVARRLYDGRDRSLRDIKGVQNKRRR